MTELRAKFCAMLAKLVQPDRAVEAAQALEALLPMLADIDERAFMSRECLNRIATAKRRTIVPAYADMREAMTSWLKDNPAPRAALTDQSMADWKAEDHSWLRFWQKVQADGFADAGMGSDYLSKRAHYESMLRRYSPKAWAHIQPDRTPTPAWEPRTPEACAYAKARVIDAIAAMRAPRARAHSAVEVAELGAAQ